MVDREWQIDADGSLRTASGMKVAELTADGYLEVVDRVEHQVVRVSLFYLVYLWQMWRSRLPP
jgi:hypothetical protein